MMRTWKMIGLETLLAALLAATPGLGSNTSGPLTDAEKLEQIQKQLDELRKSLTGLEKKITDLRVDLENLRSRPPGPNRISAFPPADTGAGTVTGRVEMVNTYSQPVSVVINNRRSYLLAPGERRLSDPIPAGAFTYEVLGVTPAVTRTVAADKTFTVWVHPQP